MPFAESPATTYRGIRVRLPDGTTRESLSILAREIGCRPQALRRHIVDHAGGCAILGSLPDPRRCGPRHPRSKERASYAAAFPAILVEAPVLSIGDLDLCEEPMTAYTISPFIGAESGAAAAEGCYSYGIALDRPGTRGFVIGSFEDGDQLAAAVERARREPAYLVELLLQSLDLRQHHHEASRADWERERARQRERLEVAEPLTSDLGGRVHAALAALHTAGELMQDGASTDAWLAVVRAADALDRRAGLSCEQAALRAVEHFERWVNAGIVEASERAGGVVSCSWDAAAGAWYVECRAEGLRSVWGVSVTAEGAEVVDET